MTLHLARSDGRKSGWKECDDEIMLSIVFIRIIDQPVLCGWQSKVETLSADELHLFLGSQRGKRKKNK
jgi:hypothetical protein